MAQLSITSGSSVSYGAPAYLDDTFCGINSPTSLFTVVGTSAQRTALAAVINSNNPMISSRLATILLPNIANDNDPYRAQFMTPSGDASWVPDTLGGFVLRFTHNNTLTVRGRGAFPLHEMCHSHVCPSVPLTGRSLLAGLRNVDVRACDVPSTAAIPQPAPASAAPAEPAPASATVAVAATAAAPQPIPAIPASENDLGGCVEECPPHSGSLCLFGNLARCSVLHVYETE